VSAFAHLHQRSRCHQCRGLRFSSPAEVRRYLGGERVRLLAREDVAELPPEELLRLLRSFLNLTGQLGGLCADCSSSATARALEPRRKRRRAA
jgi:hypothetical protein